MASEKTESWGYYANPNMSCLINGEGRITGSELVFEDILADVIVETHVPAQIR